MAATGEWAFPLVELTQHDSEVQKCQNQHFTHEREKSQNSTLRRLLWHWYLMYYYIYIYTLIYAYNIIYTTISLLVRSYLIMFDARRLSLAAGTLRFS